MPNDRIRLAAATDAQAVQAIYAPVVRDTVISFETEPPDAAEIARRIEYTLPAFPWLVLERDGAFAGYAYASRHRERRAYQWSVDVSCYVDERFRGRGVGGALYRTLLAVLRRQGFFNAYAGITLPNDASVRLHESVGFRAIGVYPHVGYKLGAWHSVGWWGCEIAPPRASPAEPVALGRLGPRVLDGL
ncbi:MAG TPA: arsinothricin resistance N-acetyltransferase ArsN1 family B [Usitatibacter sp.]|nr:arsinothricin resistance N-acetyltransferase ArsN1 family B [Usitatibacter sp.]